MQKLSLPEALYIDQIPGPIGTMLVIHDAQGRMRGLDFHDCEPRMRQLFRRYYGVEGTAYVLKGGVAPAIIRRALSSYFAGDLGAIDCIPVVTAGTDFQRAVWAALRKIRPGTTISYGALARQLGRPRSMRAVGLANGANPIGIVVPCHRVIGADASLTGYGGGIDRKRWLLTHEGATFKASVGRDVGGLAFVSH
jgi:methylated-DNA-[protein]-cysteine S-methyltransferase